MTLPLVNPHVTPAESVRFTRFLAGLEAEGLSASTCACYASDWWNVSHQAHDALGHPFHLLRYRPEDFLVYRAREAARGVSPATLNRRLAFLRRYASSSVGRPLGFERIPFQPVTRPSTRALGPEEERSLRAAAEAEGASANAMVALLLGSGLRAAEVAGLHRGDVEGPKGAPHALRVRGERPKTIVLPPRASAALAALLRDHAGPAEPLFRDEDGGPLPEPKVAETVARLARAAGVEATPRTLRHTFAVGYLREHRDDVEGLARALGQASLASARAYRDEANAEGGARLVRWEDLPEERPSPRVERRVLRGARLEASRTVRRPGATFPETAHPEEQVVYVVSGRIVYRVGDRRVEAGPGDLVVIPAGTAHRAQVEGDGPAVTLDVAVHSKRAPARGSPRARAALTRRASPS
jgi:integrase/recombinase XerC